jgi:ribonuclease P protein component
VARRAVERNLVKRILREAARLTLPQLNRAAAARRIDVVLRLRSAFPRAEEMSLAAFRRALRGDADLVLQRLIAQLEPPAQR